MSNADIPGQFSAPANSFARFNLLNNGGFTAFPTQREFVPNTDSNVGLGSNAAIYTLIDRRQYEPVSFSFAPAAEAGQENQLGSWDVYGVSASLEVAPKDATTEQPIIAPDGGNLLRINFSEKGSVFLEQQVEDIPALRGQLLTLAYSGRAFKGNVTIYARLLSGDEVLLEDRSDTSTFGGNRRTVRQVLVPVEVTTLRFQIELVGTVGAVCGLSSVVALLGPAGSSVAFVPSIADLVVPSGTVIMLVGDACPPGYQRADGGQEALLLGVTGQHALLEAGQTIGLIGKDEHDHNPNGALDTLSDPIDATHQTDAPIPFDSQDVVHTPLFGSEAQFPGEKSADILGVAHTHSLNTKMVCVPPSFPVRICIKL